MEIKNIINFLIILFVIFNAVINIKIFILCIPFLVIYVAYYVSKNKFGYKFYFTSLFALLVLEGLLIAYTYYFKSIFIKNSADFFIFLFCLGMMILLICINSYYIFTGKYKDFPWLGNR